MATTSYKVYVRLLLLVFMTVDLKVQGEINLVTLNKQRVIQTGKNLQINCTAFGSENYSNLELKWKKVGSLVETKSHKITNNTLQLEIKSVEKFDEGEYRCVVMRKAHVINSTYVHVIVGDLPSKPSISRWHSVNWQICFDWHPVSSTGGLPVTYTIQYRCVSDCDDLIDDEQLTRWQEEICKNTLHTTRREMRCCLNYVHLFVNYEAVLVAQNLIGSTTSSPVKFTRGLQTTPGPPQSLQAQPTGYGEITIDWTPNQNSLYQNRKYTILYHAQGKSTNKSITVDSNGQNHYRLTGLKPYTNYTVYVAGNGLFDDAIGIPVGPVVILTNEEHPSDAPEITDWNSNVYPENPNRRNITITWKLPSKSKWNGAINQVIIQYRKIIVSNEQIETTSRNLRGQTLTINITSENKGTISDVISSCGYEVVMQMCNRAGCGGIGNRVVIDGLKINPNIEENRVGLFISSTATFVIVITIISITSFIPLLVYATIKSFSFRKKQPRHQDTPSCNPIKKTSYYQMKGELAV